MQSGHEPVERPQCHERLRQIRGQGHLSDGSKTPQHRRPARRLKHQCQHGRICGAERKVASFFDDVGNERRSEAAGGRREDVRSRHHVRDQADSSAGDRRSPEYGGVRCELVRDPRARHVQAQYHPAKHRHLIRNLADRERQRPVVDPIHAQHLGIRAVGERPERERIQIAAVTTGRKPDPSAASHESWQQHGTRKAEPQDRSLRRLQTQG